MKKVKIKNQKGITLIALVITIIVMLILVVVTIRISAEGKLFDYAGRAARDTKNAVTGEQNIGEGYIKIGNEIYSIEEIVGVDWNKTLQEATTPHSEQELTQDIRNRNRWEISKFRFMEIYRRR